MKGPVTVQVEPNGQVLVNGRLVAEVTIPTEAGGPDAVVCRDELIRQLTAHRCAGVIAERLTELTRYTEDTRFDDSDRRDFGAALFAGLAGEPGELTGRRAYRDGHRAGLSLRVLREHIVAALPDHAAYRTLDEEINRDHR